MVEDGGKGKRGKRGEDDAADELAVEDLEELNEPTDQTLAAPPPPPAARAMPAPSVAVGKPKSARPPPAHRAPAKAVPVKHAAAVTLRDAERAPPAEAVRLRLLCEAQLEGEPDPQRKARLAYELGRIHELELRDLAKAATHYELALRHAPNFVAAMRGARRSLAGLGRHGALPPLFDAEIAATSTPAARARLLLAKARVLESDLRQYAPALAVYREALALDPGNVSILKAIERSLRRDGAWRPLADTYADLANAITDPALKAAWTSIRAHLTETRLNEPVQAAALYQSALDTDPHAAPALAHVKRLGASQGRWPELIAALRKEHELTRDADTRQAILWAIARIEERHVGNAEAAMRTIEEALRTRPDDRSLLSELARLMAMNGRPPVAALARLAERSDDPEEIAEICHRIARTFEQDLGDAERARPWYEKSLASDARHRASALALSRLYEERQDWNGLLRVMTTRANAITATEEQADLFHRMGNILEEKLARAADATAHHARAIGLDPSHAAAFRALARLLAEAGRWQELAELYGRAIDRAPHDAEAIAWLFRLGGVLEDRIGDPHGALAAYERILARDPVHLGALHATARAAERAGRFERVTEALRAEAQITADDTRKNALLHRAAVITAERLRDPAGARQMLEAILASAPQHRPSLETLAELASDAGRWDELVSIYQRLIPLAPDNEEKVRLHLRIGEVQATQLGKDVDAIATYRLAIGLDPGCDVARDAMIAALERTKAYEALARAHEERLPRLKDPVARARAATELGALYEEKLNDRAKALQSYEKAITAVPLHRPALDARERLLTDANSKDKLALVLQQEAAASGDDFERLQASLRAALAMSEQLGPDALEAFRPIFTARPDHVGALLAVEEIYERAANDAGLAATFERMAEVTQDPKAKLAALRSLAQARASSDANAAVAVQHRVLSLAPDDTAAIEEILAAAERTGDVDTQIGMHTRLAQIAADTTLVAYHQCRVGELLLARQDARGALGAFAAAVNADPWSLTATDGLTRSARAAQDAGALSQAARYENAVTRDRGAAVALHLEAARLLFQADMEDDAAGAYSEALALSPDNPEAAMGLTATMMRHDRIAQLVELLTEAAHAATDRSRISILHLCVAQLHADVLLDLPAAIAATRRAVTARPENETGLSTLATYLERNEQWNEAVEMLERLIKRGGDAMLIDAHLRLANIAEKHLRDPERAKASLRVVLAKHENHADALTSMVRLERVTGHDEEALRLARKLITVVVDDVHRANALAEMAELEKKRGQIDEAANAAYWAIGVQGPAGTAARLYRGLIASSPEHASWDHYSTALLTYLDRAKKKGGDFASAYRELARVFGEAHHRPDRAMDVLREAVEVIPMDASISLSLVRALRAAGENTEALSELRRYLTVDVVEVGTWRNLAEVLQGLGVSDGAACALAPLVALGQASPEEERTVRSRRVAPGRAPVNILGGSGLKVLMDGNALDESCAAFIPGISEIVKQLEGFEHERWGVSKRDRIRHGDPHPMRTFADRIARIFGVPEYDLYVGVSAVPRPYIISGSPPALLVPPGLDGARESVLAFHLARPLALLSRQLHPLDHIDDAALERLLVGTVRQFDPRFRIDPMFEEEELDREARRVGKAIGFFSRGRIQEAVAAFVASPPAMIPMWSREIRRAAARAALLVSDDLLSTLEALGEMLGPDNYASDLARFWVSDPAIRFRRAISQQTQTTV